jgi:hypothetical protein
LNLSASKGGLPINETSINSIGLAALGIVVMQASIALFGFGALARMAALGVGLGLITVAALLSAGTLPRHMASQIALIVFSLALGFEVLSFFNNHLVFEPKGIIFRLICYLLILFGIFIGIATGKDECFVASKWTTTLAVTIVLIAAAMTFYSLQGMVQAEATRGGFDDSSPVALGFSSGTLAVAALVFALRSVGFVIYAIGLAGYTGWFIVCLQSGSRGALLSLVLISLIVSVLSLAGSPKRVAGLLVVAVIFLTGRLALGDGVASQASYVFDRFESVLNFEWDPSIAGGADSRAYLLDYNLKLPGLLLFGGEGFDPQAYPHNFEVEALVRLGAPLALVFVASVIYLLWRMVCLLRLQGSDIGLAVVFGMGLFTFFNAQTNMMWEFLRPLWLSLGLAFGMVVARRKMVSAVDN